MSTAESSGSHRPDKPGFAKSDKSKGQRELTMYDYMRARDELAKYRKLYPDVIDRKVKVINLALAHYQAHFKRAMRVKVIEIPAISESRLDEASNYTRGMVNYLDQQRQEKPF